MLWLRATTKMVWTSQGKSQVAVDKNRNIYRADPDGTLTIFWTKRKKRVCPLDMGITFAKNVAEEIEKLERN